MASVPNSPLTVLIADDEPLLRRAVGRILERAGHVVYTAERADEALALMRAHRFQVALVDHHMPGGGGRAVLEALERDPDFDGLAVLMTGDDVQDAGLPGGPGVHRLQKPFPLDTVVSLVAGAGERGARGRDEVSPFGHTALLVEAGWIETADRLLGGLTHDLNGRVTSLGGMAQLLSLDEDARSMVPFLDEEVRRLAAAVKLLALLGGAEHSDPAALSLEELTPPLVELHRRHRGLEGVEVSFEASAPCPVVQPPPTLTRAILLFLAIGGHEALDRSQRLDVAVRPGPGTGAAQLRVMAPGSRQQADGASWRHPVEPLARLIGRLGGTLRVDTAPDRYQLTVHLASRRHDRR